MAADDLREVVTAVLGEHRYREVLGDYDIAPFYKHFGCSCGWEQNIAGMSGWRSWRDAHTTHVVDALAHLLAAHPTPSEPEAGVFCNVEHPETGARCIKEYDDPPHGDTHYGYSHYPGQLVSWPVDAVPWPADAITTDAEPASSNPGSKLEQVGAAGGGLSEEEREELRTAYPYIDVGDDRTGVEHVVERIVREREAAAWDAAVDEAYDCGWFHSAARINVQARNPYRSADR